MFTNKVLITVVIPTYNRSKYLLKILEILKKNFLNFKFFEIIICDSFSKDSTNLKVNFFKKENKFINITYLNIAQNNHALKRNKGVECAKGKYIIFLDDDCMPKDNNFIKEYYSIFKKNFHHRKIVYCGLVMFPKFLLIKNFIKYRQSRHVLLDMNSSKNILNLRPDKIVTMNMGFQKNNYIIKTKLFNKDFNCYGFEDYEFGFRLLESGFKIILCKPLVYHYDSRSYPSYMKKIEFLGFKSMKRLIQVNFLAAKDNNFYKLEDNFFIKYFLNFYFFKIVLIFLRRFAVFHDRHLFYSSLIYKIGIISSYLLGCFNKKMYLYEYYKIKSWYK
jgi:glycosyltransferase involved in cell wall biosynthesis